MVRQVRTIDKKKENTKFDGKRKSRRGGGKGKEESKKERKNKREKKKRKSKNIRLVPCRNSQQDP